MLAIIAPLEIEIKRLRTMLEVDSTVYYHPGRIWHGRLGGHEICMARAGVGKTAMRRCADQCIRRFHPTALLLIGFGGATDPAVRIGDLILCEQIIDAATEQRFQADPTLLEEATKAAARTGIATRPGIAVTASSVITAPHDKAFLGTQHHATIVEMEGSSFASVASAAGLPWLMIRAVADSIDTALPEGLSCAEDGTISLATVAYFVCQHPRVIGQLASLHLAAIKAREAITQFTQSWLAG